ncbi:MAG: RNA polymerase sigma factor [Lachnospiraceae bacterium]|nr:RNA polymerase sigma factor [Lachnospiraceae bacterium]
MGSAPRQRFNVDKEIFKRIVENDKDAFKELYEKTHTVLYAFLLSYTQNAEDAKDLLQETYINIYKNCYRYKEKGNPMAWMMEIAKNLFLMKHRKEKNIQEVNFEHINSVCGLEQISNVDNRILIESLFKVLSDVERKIIVLHDVAGLKNREIANILDLPIGTVLAKYSRAIKK